MTRSSKRLREAEQIPKPVLLVGRFLSRSLGLHGVCEDLAAQLERSGWPVTITSDKAGKLARVVDMISTVWKNRRKYSVVNVDVYSGLGFFWAEVVCAMLRRIGKPYILTLHGGNLPSFAARRRKRVIRLLRSAAAVTTPSPYFCKAMACYRADIQLLPNPLDLSLYQFFLRSRPLPRLVWLRSFHSLYNPAIAPRVVACVEPDFPNVRLTMIGPDKGDGSFRTTRELVRTLGIETKVEFVGTVLKAEVPKWLNKADIFLNTTTVDNTPVSVLEAMACGLCIVSTNVGGIPYLLEDEVDALLIPPDDHDAMAAAVRRLLTEPNLAERLSENARKKVARFDWSVILPQWKALLAAVANSNE